MYMQIDFFTINCIISITAFPHLCLIEEVLFKWRYYATGMTGSRQARATKAANIWRLRI